MSITLKHYAQYEEGFPRLGRCSEGLSCLKISFLCYEKEVEDYLSSILEAWRGAILVNVLNEQNSCAEIPDLLV